MGKAPILVVARNAATRTLVAHALSKAGYHNLQFAMSAPDLRFQLSSSEIPAIAIVVSDDINNALLSSIIEGQSLANTPTITITAAECEHAPEGAISLVASSDIQAQLTHALVQASEACTVEELSEAPTAQAPQSARNQSTHDEQLSLFAQIHDHAHTILKAIATDKLPVPIAKASLIDLRRLADRDGLDPRRLEGFLRNEPALAAKLLQLANSAYYSPATQIKNIPAAMRQIGVERCLLLLQSMALREYIPSGDSKLSKLGERALARAVHVALIAETLAQRARANNPADVFALGLFHNIAETIFIYAWQHTNDTCELNRAGLDSALSHFGARLTKAICAKLSLPEELMRLESHKIAIDTGHSSFSSIAFVRQAVWLTQQLDDGITTIETATAAMYSVSSGALTAVLDKRDKVASLARAL